MSGYIKKFIDDFNLSVEKEISYLKSENTYNEELDNYNRIKTPGITNPKLYTPGLYWFDTFMYYFFSQNIDITLFSENGDNIINGVTYIQDYVFFDKIFNKIKNNIISTTMVDIDSFDDMKIQYKSGELDDLKVDISFNENRGTIVDKNNTILLNKPIGYFIGNYEKISLYKAVIEAGNNYKTITLPKNSLENDISYSKNNSVTINSPEIKYSNIIFNVSVKDKFTATSGTMSGREFYMFNGNLSDYFNIDNGTQNDDYEIGEEYIEDEYSGSEEQLINFHTYIEKAQDIEIPSDVKMSSLLISKIDWSDKTYVGPKWKSYDIDYIISMINKTKYKGSFKESLKAILYYIQKDGDIIDIKHASYLLATAYAESSYSLYRWEGDYLCKGAGIPYGPYGPCQKAINYYKSTKGKVNYYTLGTDSKGQCFFGRGLIQLTGKGNYAKYGPLIGVDLLNNSDLAMVPENSYKIAVTFMRAARTFKHVSNGNLILARKSVNGGTKAINEVNEAYNAWLNIFSNL